MQILRFTDKKELVNETALTEGQIGLKPCQSTNYKHY